MRGYQPDFFCLSAGVRSTQSRLAQAAKLRYLLTDLAHIRTGTGACLDLGCSSGIVTAALAPLFGAIHGLDFDETALRHAEHSSAADFVRGDAMRLPFANDAFDVIICAQVYEHVPDDRLLASEVYRVLKPGGIVVFTGPNRLFPIELHYNLWFLQWLPPRLADLYVRLCGKGDHYYERSRTARGLRKLLSAFTIRDVTLEVLRYRQQVSTSAGMRLTRLVPSFIWSALLPFFPNYNWLLCKPVSTK